MDIRLRSARLLAAALGLTLAALAAPPESSADELPKPRVNEKQAIQIAERDGKAAEALRNNPDLHRSAERDDGDGDWEVGFFDDDSEVVQVIVGDLSGEIEESWTGHQIAWRMARGYEGAFGRKLNAPYVWLPLCAIFLLGLLDWRRLRRVAHLDLLVLVGGFGLSHYFFNRGEIGLSVPLVYPALIYLLARMLWIGFRGGGGLNPTAPAIWLAIAALFLTGFKVGLNVADSNVIDVGYAGVIGADQITDGDPLYGNYPDDNHAGDTYGPASYYAYVPFEQVFPWGGEWDELPAAHAAAIFFDLATLAGLFLLGRRLRPSRNKPAPSPAAAQPAQDVTGGRSLRRSEAERGTALGAALAFAWAACPYTAYALESNTNDSLLAALLVATLLVITSPAMRGAMLAIATATKFVPLALFPLLANPGFAAADANNRATGTTDDDADNAAATGGTDADRPSTKTSAHAQAPLGKGPVARYAAAFIATLLLLMAQFLLDPGPSVFFDRTIGNQLGRESPFSVWGQEPSLEWLHTAIKIGAVCLGILVAFRPRRRDLATVAALGAAVLIAFQLIAEHWFYLYIPWLLPFLFVALLVRSVKPQPA